MGPLLNRFRTLQWRLTASYTLVTLLAVLLLELIFWSVGDLIFVRSPQLPRDVVPSLERLAPETIPYLDQSPPDRHGLALWLADTTRSGCLELTEGTLGFATPPVGTSRAFVVDDGGQVLAAIPSSAAAPDAAVLPLLPRSAQHVMLAALHGVTRPGDVTTPLVGGRAVLASPIAGSGRILGALVIDWDADAARSHYLPSIASQLISFFATFTLGAGIIGLVFGFATSRGLTRRLQTIEQAAQAWSRGDFTVKARDSSADELGRLAGDLNGMAEQLRALLQERQQLAIVEERQRLARELHDSVKQQVFATTMQIAAAEELANQTERDDALKPHLAQAQQLLGQAQQELNALIRELRPAALGDKGLAPALRELCAEWSQANGIPVEVHVQGEQAAPLQVEQALFRVAQEALANVARHSGASAVDIDLAWDTALLSLSVRDNGHGFDTAHRGWTGVGLHSMAERMEALGGVLLVSSGPQGTCVEARVASGRPSSNEGDGGEESD